MSSLSFARSRCCLISVAQNKVPIKHSARQVTQADFRTFTHILAADESNLRNLQRMKPRDATAEVRLWGSYLDGEAIPDPYYGGMVSNTDMIGAECMTDR